MLTTFRFGSNEKHVREALTAAFKRRGVDLAELDPSIRSTMVAAAFSTGVEEQVAAFARFARVAEQFDLPDDLRRQVAIKAYSSYAESFPSAESTIVRSGAFQAVDYSPASAGVSQRPPSSRLNERRTGRLTVKL